MEILSITKLSPVPFMLTSSKQWSIGPKEPSAREVLIFWIMVEREERRGSEGRKRDHDSNLARIETASEPKNFVDPQPS